MTHEEVKALVEEMGLPYAYDHFAEGESPDPPFICFLYPRAENFGADNLVYHHFNRLDIEVYTDYKDPDMEANIEEVLTAHELYYENLQATPLANGYVKAKTGTNTTDDVYNKWYDAVYEPQAEAVDTEDTSYTEEPQG